MLDNAPTTGTGNVVLSNTPTLTGTLTNSGLAIFGTADDGSTKDTLQLRASSPRLYFGAGTPHPSWKIAAQDNYSNAIEIDFSSSNGDDPTVLSYTNVFTLNSSGYLNVTTGYKVGGSQIAASNLSNGVTGTGAIVLANTPTLITPVLGVATGTSAYVGNDFSQVPAFTSFSVVGSVATALGSGTGKIYGVIGTAYAVSDAVGDRAYGGWFKANYSNNASSCIALHAECVTDNATAAEFTKGGVVVGAPTGGSKGTGTINAATAYYANGTAGVTQTAGVPTSIATIGGIVTTLVVTSDERLKTASPYEGGLDKILSITPIRYEWNVRGKEVTGDVSGASYVGFGAQDVQKVIPEAVVGQQIAKDGEAYLGFDDRPVIAALVNAVKELTARVKELELQVSGESKCQ